MSSHPLCSLGAELLTFNLSDVKSHWLSELIQSSPSTFASQSQGLCLARQAAPLPRLLPTSAFSVHGLSAFPILFCGPLVYAWLPESVLLVLWQFSGLFRLMWVESKQSAGQGEPSFLLRHHLCPSSFLI